MLELGLTITLLPVTLVAFPFREAVLPAGTVKVAEVGEFAKPLPVSTKEYKVTLKEAVDREMFAEMLSVVPVESVVTRNRVDVPAAQAVVVACAAPPCCGKTAATEPSRTKTSPARVSLCVSVIVCSVPVREARDEAISPMRPCRYS